MIICAGKTVSIFSKIYFTKNISISRQTFQASSNQGASRPETPASPPQHQQQQQPPQRRHQGHQNQHGQIGGGRSLSFYDYVICLLVLGIALILYRRFASGAVVPVDSNPTGNDGTENDLRGR